VECWYNCLPVPHRSSAIPSTDAAAAEAVLWTQCSPSTNVSYADRQTTQWFQINCCCCNSPVTLLLASVIQVEEVCDCGRIIPQISQCELRRVALTVEQMLCHSTLRTNIWYAAGDAGLVTVQEPTVTEMQLGKCGTDWPREQIFERWDIRWWSCKDSVWYKVK